MADDTRKLQMFIKMFDCDRQVCMELSIGDKFCFENWHENVIIENRALELEYTL